MRRRAAVVYSCSRYPVTAIVRSVPTIPPNTTSRSAPPTDDSVSQFILDDLEELIHAEGFPQGLPGPQVLRPV